MITLQELYDAGIDFDEIEDAYKREQDESNKK